jgi:hypothetical protein
MSRPFIAYVSFYHDKVKVFETQPLAVVPGVSGTLAVAPLNFNIGVSQLQSGE